MENTIVKLQLFIGGVDGILHKSTTINDIQRRKADVDITLADTVCLEITKGSTQQKLVCKVCKCAMTQWTEWTVCSHVCGGGRSARMRTLEDDSKKMPKCKGKPMFEEETK